MRMNAQGLAIAAALTAALALAGCGRKGPLDLPPTSNAAEPAATGTPVGTSAEHDVEDLPQARGSKKRIPLDGLLN